MNEWQFNKGRKEFFFEAKEAEKSYKNLIREENNFFFFETRKQRKRRRVIG